MSQNITFFRLITCNLISSVCLRVDYGIKPDIGNGYKWQIVVLEFHPLVRGRGVSAFPFNVIIYVVILKDFKNVTAKISHLIVSNRF